jgi:transmembrane sensor
MDSEMPDELQTQAIAWHVRLRDGNDQAWEAFVGWLAEDPRHAEAYDLIEQTDLAIDPLLPDLRFHEAANDSDSDSAPYAGRPARWPRRWAIGGGALAASIAVAIAVTPYFASSRYDVITGPGERRVVALEARTQVVLNGATRMTFDHRDSRFAALGSGEALFRVTHDSARPFRLEMGDARVVDVGTVFNVIRDPSEVRIAVAEGKILYNQGAGSVPVAAGLTLVAHPGAGAVHVDRIAPEAVGAWQNGRLVYAGDPLSRVVADLNRSLGVHITVAPAIADRPYSGAIALDGSGPAQLGRLKLALNVALEPTSDGWMMKPVAGDRR